MKNRYLLKTVLSVLTACALFITGTGLRANAVTTQSGSIAKGIDVSKHQGAINWAQVKNSGVSFAFIKVGSTYSGIDPMFHYNITGAQANGIKTGVYLYSYATTPEQAALEAMLVIQWLAPYSVQLPVVFDIEDKCHKGLSAMEINTLINTFCAIVDSAGYYPMVYSYRNFYSGKIGATPWEKWAAQYGSQLEMDNSVAFWQYTSSGSVPGISGRVDMNYQYKDFSKLIIEEGFIDHYGNTRFYSGWKMQKGWVNYQGKKYYFDMLGNMVKGFFPAEDGKFYYLGEQDGAAATGLTEVAGLTYFFGEDGAMQFGFVDPGNGMRYFDPALNGAMQKSALFVNAGSFYYAKEDGTLATGITTINDFPYYFNEAGIMAINQLIEVDGVQYMATETGVLMEIPPAPVLPDPAATDPAAAAATAATDPAAATTAADPAAATAPTQTVPAAEPETP
ncbi:MAG: hypothetical protein K6F53_08665 [Lachnospiraceae bacterium]|nr:hypothetical protein [Lachnospiraceae bacterium]